MGVKLKLAPLLAGFLICGIAVSVVEPAHAERRSLLEQWFVKAKQRADENRRKWRERRARKNRKDQTPKPAQTAAAPIKKVTGPSYYTYQAEAIRAVRLGPLLSDARTKADIKNLKAIAELQTAKNSYEIIKSDLIDIGSATVSESLSSSHLPHRLTSLMFENWSIRAETGIADAIEEYYKTSPEFLWVGRDFKPNARARSILRLLEKADETGLRTEDYRVDFDDSENDLGAPQKAARFEIGLSAAILRYGADAKNGVINPNQISGYHDFPQYRRDYAKLLHEAARQRLPRRWLIGKHPDNNKFRALKRELTRLDTGLNAQAAKKLPEPIRPGVFIRPGKSHAELPKIIAAIKFYGSNELKMRHIETLINFDGKSENGRFYSPALVELVRDFQREKKLGPDGIIGKRTLAHLQSPDGQSHQQKIKIIKLAMERLRWFPKDDFGKNHVFINQPAYSASYVVDGKSKLSMRTIIGTPKNQTSFFYDTIETVEFNPYWNVPRSILVNEMLGGIRTNPHSLTRRNYEVIGPGNKVMDPASINWYSEKSTKNYYIRQKPGAKNALGELKILFPNKHNIYMHDTPSRNLFSRKKRALSHGCVRLADPRAMAAAVLGTSKKQVSAMISPGKNRAVSVKGRIPVYIAYFTAWPQDNGKISYFGDVYGRDRALQKAFEITKTTRKSLIEA